MDLKIWVAVSTYSGVLDGVTVFTDEREADEWLEDQIIGELLPVVGEEQLSAMSDEEIEAAWREHRAWISADYQIHEHVIRLDGVSEDPGPEINKDATNYGGWSDWR